MDPPRPCNIRAIDAVEIPFPHKVHPIVFRDVGTVRQFPRLILDLGGAGIETEGWQDIILDVSPSAGESLIVQPPKVSEDLQLGSGLIDEVLISPLEVVKYHPVQISRGGRKGDIDVVRAF